MPAVEMGETGLRWLRQHVVRFSDDASREERSPEVFVNARTDVFWLGSGDLDEAVRRA